MLNIEVRGIGFPNKGAELMLAAICHKLKRSGIKARIVLPPSTAPYEQRALYQAHQLAEFKKFGLNVGAIFRVVPTAIRRHLGIVLKSEIDVILDASGFAYGDQWGAVKVRQRFNAYMRGFKNGKSSRRLILMPQALGPFSDEAIKREMAKILQAADLVFARDPESLEHVEGIKNCSGNVFQAPDFTNLIQPVYSQTIDMKDKRVCFIPNAKMMEMKQDEGHYLSFMAQLLRQAHEADLKPFVLVHEGRKDSQLAEDIITEAGCDVPVIKPDTATDVKALIGMSKLVVSSRFHGLVSALSQNVPVMATGWSHKYRQLLSDYGIEDLLFDEKKDLGVAKEKMLLLGDGGEEYRRIKTLIAEYAGHEKQKSEAMWQRIFSVMENK
ncbi:hypothetical protein HMF8227_00742 [Saliniradius amylolyticus]|uniref:Polysaccharide pyruvyl transferase domain-containing protein n=1 Tax=Saliniradius amylolyticus TaxID=2183582 RepID=A0A2S2E0S1_9ALTE|nr:polysaccharide pyruvyl transferase family protein [Saliniradius amylolyticus]AWL11238.1 hypothetical protein HMF8227_00742 [Saliniradius amylolyticus]